MRRKDFFKVAIALCLALLLLLLFACEINPGGGGAGGQNGNSGNNGTVGQGGGDKKEYPVQIKLVEAGETFCTLEWDALPGENVYSLTYTVRSKNLTTMSGYLGKGTKCTVASLIPGETYYFSLWQVQPGGKARMKISDTFVMTPASPSLATPEVTVRATAYSVELSWPAIEGAGRYRIYDTTYDTWESYRASTFKNSFTHYLDNRKGGEQLSYRVVAISSNGTKASRLSKAVIATLKESTLKNWPLKQSLSSYEILFSWDTLPKGYKFDVGRLDAPSWSSITTKSKSEGSTEFSYQDVESGNQYYFRFRLKRPETGDASLHSELYKLTIPQPELATAPTNLKVVSMKESPYSPGYFDAEISWDAVDGAEEYYIYSDAFSSGTFLFKGKSKSLSYKYFFSNSYNPWVKVKVKAVKHSTKEGSDFSVPITLELPK